MTQERIKSSSRIEVGGQLLHTSTAFWIAFGPLKPFLDKRKGNGCQETTRGPREDGQGPFGA
jgi:hypothetical protein